MNLYMKAALILVSFTVLLVHDDDYLMIYDAFQTGADNWRAYFESMSPFHG